MERAGLSPGEVRALIAYDWQRSAAPDPARLAADGREAARLMALTLAFEEIFSTGGSGEFSGELALLAARIDWLTQWVLADRTEETDWRHELRPIVLTQAAAEWQEPGTCAPGQWGVLRFYPEPRLSRSLAFWVEVERVSPEPDGCRIHAQWRGHNEETQELLGKLLFRLHRQEVARARQQI
ncbi:PilZ domain-containing protein [Candidatus Macondimonas diazotrophica]|jgi:hypothetical protein|uniref:Cyclic di-GMP receptor atypical PilZ domain-containing protein n=1 Tax=Candidatus Macondimonas diazotrophica TaxID=2305248 RepID=A0A4Z0FAS9_9GAMM|nr:PilZ domain-containing protein [Candidatus Macondimonas diazotrophica]NCU00887.1 hypothetical protein [Candidatus Macondimonas diazotrophica]TFZ83284.1 hypothetical protein E4680_04330 [Candidatus Macondimonas diazotrophica]HBG29422.1 hypothetical protein [Gammaproteobacteria bacterium]